MAESNAQGTDRHKSLMTVSIGLTAVTAIFSAVAMTGGSTQSSIVVASAWARAKVSGNIVGGNFIGGCVFTGNDPCTSTECQIFCAAVGAGGVTPPGGGCGTRACFNYAACPGVQYPNNPSGYYIEDEDRGCKCSFYARTMSTLAILTFILTLVKLGVAFGRRDPEKDSPGRKYLGLGLLFFAWLFGVIVLGTYSHNCLGPLNKALNLPGVRESKAVYGPGFACMVIAVLFWGFLFIIEAIVPAGNGTLLGIGGHHTPPVGSRKLISARAPPARPRAAFDRRPRSPARQPSLITHYLRSPVAMACRWAATIPSTRRWRRSTSTSCRESRDAPRRRSPAASLQRPRRRRARDGALVQAIQAR